MQIRKQLVKNTGILMTLGMLLSPMAADARQGAGNGNKGSQAGLSSIVANLPYETLSEAEATGLIHMREEEKLAHDVYQTLYDTWRLPIFTNIAAAEFRHMTAVKSLLIKYGVDDPVTDLTVGVFTDPGMQVLYVDLVAKGELSLIDALDVGATIEDLDIFDLYELLYASDEDGIKIVDNLDVRTVYQNLAKGSRNHLRAFVEQLFINGVINDDGIIYVAQSLTQEEIEAIVDSPWERGMVNENGLPVTSGRGPGNKTGGGQGGRQ
jgi:hypothetical protein